MIARPPEEEYFGHDHVFPSSVSATLAGLGCALRATWREGYSLSKLRADFFAGCVVGVVALPLSMALSIASGVSPKHGLYTAIIAGGLAALLGGSRVLVSGPTAAFVVILAPISARFGLQGLVLSTALAGCLLLGLGLLRMGRLIQFVPYPVVTGFTAGIGIVIASLQIADFLGLELEKLAGEAMWHERMGQLLRHLSSLSWSDCALGLATLLVLVLWRRVKTSVPAPLVALFLAALAAFVLKRWGDVEVATLAQRFGSPAAPSGVPRGLPPFTWPWELPDADGVPRALSLAFLRELLPSAFAIAMLGAIESLLAAVVSDGMIGARHDSDVELAAQGLANIAASLFAGFAATGAIARTATNVRSGGRSPVSALVHALFVLACVLVLAPLLGWLPMSALAALLLVVAWNMSEARHVLQMLRTAPSSDIAVMLTCLVLTVVFDMTISVAVGVMLAGLLFMRRMIEISGAELITPQHKQRGGELPAGMLVFDIAGPLFFGAAHKATSALFQLDPKHVRCVLLDLEDVPVIDATGLVNLRSALERLRSAGIAVQMAGLAQGPRRALEKAGLLEFAGLEVFDSAARALEVARARAVSSAASARG